MSCKRRGTNGDDMNERRDIEKFVEALRSPSTTIEPTYYGAPSDGRLYIASQLRMRILYHAATGQGWGRRFARDLEMPRNELPSALVFEVALDGSIYCNIPGVQDAKQSSNYSYPNTTTMESRERMRAWRPDIARWMFDDYAATLAWLNEHVPVTWRCERVAPTNEHYALNDSRRRVTRFVFHAQWHCAEQSMYTFSDASTLTLSPALMEALLKRKVVMNVDKKVHFIAGDKDVWLALDDREYIMALRTGTVQCPAEVKPMLVDIFDGVLGSKEDSDCIVLKVNIKRTYEMGIEYMPEGMPSYLYKTHTLNIDGEKTQVTIINGTAALEVVKTRDGYTVWIPSHSTYSVTMSENRYNIIVAALLAAKTAWVAANKPRNTSSTCMRL
jgi:hypothetical protein